MKRLVIVFFAITVTTGLAQSTFYDVTPGDGFGLRFWQSDYYKIHMGSGAEYQYGPVYDYSIKMNMSNTPGRGWTWGVVGLTPVASLNTSGMMQINSGLYVGPHFSAGLPVGRLAVTGSGAEISLSNRQVSSVVESPQNGERWVIYNEGTPTDGRLRFWSGGDKIVFTKESNIGIGLSNPAQRLDVNGQIAINGVPVINTGASNGNDIYINGRVIRNESTVHSDGMYLNYNSSGGGGAHLKFFANGTTERMRIDAGNGNVGIGTASPNSKLHVQGGGGTNVDLAVNGRISTGDGSNYGGVWVSTANNLFMGQSSTTSLGLYNNGAWRLIADNTGNVGIGTTTPDYKLTVKGKIHAEEVKVDLSVPGPDYVFEPDYQLTTLEELKSYINEHKHLPEIPSAKEMQANGINLMEMNVLLLKKLEELTLLLIKTNEKLTSAEARIEKLEHNP